MGLLLLSLTVGFFVAIARRDSRTEREGERYAGRVVAQVPTRWYDAWDLFDCGRIRVEWFPDGERRLATIWLDDAVSEHPVGEQVTVLVRGGHVRTTEEANDPAPLGMVAVLNGLAGLGLVGWGLARRGAPAPVRLDGTTTLVPLRTWRLSPRKARLELSPGQLSVYLPAYFGGHRLVVPTIDVVFADLDADDDELPDDPPEHDVWFEEPLRVADFPTASTLVEGSLVLAFVRPVRVPPLRWVMAMSDNVDLPFGYFSSRRGEGAHVDAVRLRPADREAAAGALRLAGVRQVDDPLSWLSEHRALETDPEVISELQELDRRSEVRGRWFFRGAVLGFPLLVVARFTDDFRWAAVGGGAFGALWLVGQVVSRLPDRRPGPVEGSPPPSGT